MTAPAVLLEWTPTHRMPRHRRKIRRRLALVFLVLLAGAMALPATAIADVYRWAGVDDRTPTDAIVVLGAAQYQGIPSPVLANRLDHAHELFDDGVAGLVITVGGFQPGDITSEAQAGKEALVADGLRREDVIAVPFGDDTAESMQDVATVAAGQGIESITVVTDPAHAARTRALAEALGLEAHVSTTRQGPGTTITNEYLLRESAGLVDVWLDR
jgi:uncharacterized SAM-binding protein YcdF (DUF218 family)